MRRTALAVLVVTAFATSGAFAASTTVTNSDNCKVVHLKPGESPPNGSMSTSITAGNGHVSGQTTTGNGVSVQSGSGVGTSVATSTTANGRTTTVTSANGNCTVYVQPEK